MDGDFDGDFVGDSEGLDVGDVVGGDVTTGGGIGGQAPAQTAEQDWPWLLGKSTQEPAITETLSGITPPVPTARAIAACSIDTTFPAGSNVILTTAAAKRKTTRSPVGGVMAVHSEKSTSHSKTSGFANNGTQICDSISSLSAH